MKIKASSLHTMGEHKPQDVVEMKNHMKVSKLHVEDEPQPAKVNAGVRLTATRIMASVRLLAAASLINSLSKKLTVKIGAEMKKFIKDGTDEGRIVLKGPLTAKQFAALQKLKAGKKYFPEGKDGNYVAVTKAPKEGATVLWVNVH